ncbi:MAG: hypothetical protein WBA76_00135 [Phormidesmis sp.]
MTSFPGSPRLLKGAIVGLDKFSPLSSVIVFQYNPDTMSRSLSPRMLRSASNSDNVSSPKEAMRITGPPKETITLKVEIDATDQLEVADPIAVKSGIHPQLAALELLMYPKMATVLTNRVLSKTGMLEVVPMEMPLALLVWGLQRTLPVRLESLSIDEQAFDASLNPIRAEASLSLQVLSYADLPFNSKGGGLFAAHQVQKEILATATSALSAVSQVTGGVLPI